MKKRKPPVVLASVLVILVGVGLAINTSSQAKSDPAKSPVADEAAKQPIDAPRPPESKPAIMDDLQRKMAGNKDTGKPMPGNLPGGPPGGPRGDGPAPSVKVPKDSDPAPQENNDPNRVSRLVSP